MDRNIDDLPRSELEAIANAPIDAGEAPPRLSLVCVRCVRMRSQGYFFLGFYFPGFFSQSSLCGPMRFPYPADTTDR